MAQDDSTTQLPERTPPGLGALLLSMLKIGTIGFGGGSALIPVMEKELVLRRGFLDQRAYTLHTVIANITPGALPVKLATLAGGRSRSALAGLLSAFAVALPGSVATVGLIVAFSLLGPTAIRYVEFAAVGITAFIIVLLIHYITKVMRSSGSRTRVYVGIMLLAWGATGANGLVRLVSLAIGQGEFPRLPQLSAVGLIVAALVVIGVVSLLPRRTSHAGDDSDMAEPLPNLRPKFQAIALNVIVCAAAAVAAIILGGPIGGEVMGLVAFSTVTSFGGGEAYVGVADGFFVASGLVPSQMFYGQIVPVANALPGPILVKVASGVGYSVGSGLGGPALGIVFAACSYAMAIGSCCAVALVVITAWTKVARSAFMINLGRYILPVICGLLLTTSVSMILANAEIATRAGIAPRPVALGSVAAIAGLWWLQRRFRLDDLVLLGGAGVTSLVVFLLIAA